MKTIKGEHLSKYRINDTPATSTLIYININIIMKKMGVAPFPPPKKLAHTISYILKCYPLFTILPIIFIIIYHLIYHFTAENFSIDISSGFGGDRL